MEVAIQINTDDTYGVFDEITNTDLNEWSPKKEEFLRKIADKHGALVWMNGQTENSYLWINKIWSIIIAVFIIICGGGGLPSVIGDTIPSLSITMDCLTMFAGGVSIVQSIIGLDTLAKDHGDAATRNSELYLFILKELGEKNFKLRIRGDRFLHMVIEKDTLVKNRALPIPARIVRKYYRKFGETAIPYKELFQEDELLKIDDDLLMERKHEKSVTRLIEHSLKIPKEPPSQMGDESLNNMLKDHNVREKEKAPPRGNRYIRPVPNLDPRELALLEKYLSD